MTDKPRVFLDANILIRGITFPRFPYEVLRHAARGDFILILSPMVLIYHSSFTILPPPPGCCRPGRL
jgi:hypothetical protein